MGRKCRGKRIRQEFGGVAVQAGRGARASPWGEGWHAAGGGCAVQLSSFIQREGGAKGGERKGARGKEGRAWVGGGRAHTVKTFGEGRGGPAR